MEGQNWLLFYVGIKFVRAMSYADNIILLAPTVKALKILITICELYAAEFDIKLNGAKSKYMVCKGRNCDIFNIDIYVNGDVVAKVTSADHLGHHISSVNNTSMIQAAEALFWKSLNLFLATFGYSYSVVKNKL